MDDRLVLGVDPASNRLAMVAIAGDKFVVDFVRLGSSGPEACAAATKAACSFATRLTDQFDQPVAAFIEMPVLGRGGVRSTMVQAFVSGATQSGLILAWCSVALANPSTWKKQTVGRGNATKEEVGAWLRLRWDALHAAAAGNQDILDAAAIAIYGQRVLSGELG